MTKIKPRVYHWWPGRCQTWIDAMIPVEVFFNLFRHRAIYMTVASANLDGIVIHAAAYCSRKDHPSRKTGRELALSRLRAVVEPLGYSL